MGWTSDDPRQSRTSRAALYRAQAELRECGYLWQVESAKPGRAPRWLPTVPTIIPAPRTSEDSHTENPSSQTENRLSHTETRNHTQTSSTPHVGSKDQDSASRPISREIAVTDIEKADRRKLAKFATNLGAKDVDTLWGWMRTGHTVSGEPNTPMDRPGATAARLHKLKTDDGSSQWQGMFRRFYLTEQQKADGVTVRPEGDQVDDPWASQPSVPSRS